MIMSQEIFRFIRFTSLQNTTGGVPKTKIQFLVRRPKTQKCGPTNIKYNFVMFKNISIKIK